MRGPTTRPTAIPGSQVPSSTPPPRPRFRGYRRHIMEVTGPRNTFLWLTHRSATLRVMRHTARVFSALAAAVSLAGAGGATAVVLAHHHVQRSVEATPTTTTSTSRLSSTTTTRSRPASTTTTSVAHSRAASRAHGGSAPRKSPGNSSPVSSSASTSSPSTGSGHVSVPTGTTQAPPTTTAAPTTTTTEPPPPPTTTTTTQPPPPTTTTTEPPPPPTTTTTQPPPPWDVYGATATESHTLVSETNYSITQLFTVTVLTNNSAQTPVPGATVIWTPIPAKDDCTLSSPESMTNSAGQASVTVTCVFGQYGLYEVSQLGDSVTLPS